MARPAAPVRRTYVVLAVAAGLGPSCGSPDTVVLVGVQGATPALVQLEVEAMVGAETRSLRVPAQPGTPFFLPTNFTLQIPRRLSGALRVTVIAVDTTRRAIASGTGTISLEVGERNELTVTIGGGGPDGGPEDAGADAPALDAATPDLPAADAADGRPDDLAAAPDAAPADAAPDAPIDGAPDGAVDAGASDRTPDTAGDAASDPAADARDGG